ncbi:hypothetical protein BSL78_04152 [Apostichopus japonicus]|uniref:Uncharacterized protein n=1 Tax=Stichopus japonicus TaxID=307972 RepID=A0A2G8LFC0_STIJA|nr:hypothetical protein BSL78_04152 [Apostichopus japonicus]
MDADCMSRGSKPCCSLFRSVTSVYPIVQYIVSVKPKLLICVKVKELEELLNSCSCVWTEVGNSRAVSSAVAERDCCEVVPTCNGFDVLPVEELRDVDDGNEVSQERNSEWLVVDEVCGDCDVIEDGSVVANSGQWGQEKSKGRMVLCGDSLVRYVDESSAGRIKQKGSGYVCQVLKSRMSVKG